MTTASLRGTGDAASPIQIDSDDGGEHGIVSSLNSEIRGKRTRRARSQGGLEAKKTKSATASSSKEISGSTAAHAITLSDSGTDTESQPKQNAKGKAKASAEGSDTRGKQAKSSTASPSRTQSEESERHNQLASDEITTPPIHVSSWRTGALSQLAAPSPGTESRDELISSDAEAGQEVPGGAGRLGSLRPDSETVNESVSRDGRSSGSDSRATSEAETAAEMSPISREGSPVRRIAKGPSPSAASDKPLSTIQKPLSPSKNTLSPSKSPAGAKSSPRTKRRREESGVRRLEDFWPSMASATPSRAATSSAHSAPPASSSAPSAPSASSSVSPVGGAKISPNPPAWPETQYFAYYGMGAADSFAAPTSTVETRQIAGLAEEPASTSDPQSERFHAHATNTANHIPFYASYGMNHSFAVPMSTADSGQTPVLAEGPSHAADPPKQSYDADASTSATGSSWWQAYRPFGESRVFPDPMPARGNDNMPGAFDVRPEANDFLLPEDGNMQIAAGMQDILNNLAAGNVTAAADTMGQMFQNDEEAIADMANLKPISRKALKYLQTRGLKTELKKHQASGLRFLVESEHRQAPKCKDDGEVCLWRARRYGNRTWWNNRVIEGAFNEAPRMPRGCILADTMGLGKTLSILCLLLVPADGELFMRDDDPNDGFETAQEELRSIKAEPISVKGKQKALPAPATSSTEEEDIKPAKSRRSQLAVLSDSEEEASIWDFGSENEDCKPNGKGKGKGKGEGKDRALSLIPKSPLPKIETLPEPPNKPTLIICPLSVLSNWSNQTKAHFSPKKLKFATFHGSDAQYLRAQKSWKKYSFILTTYDVVKSSYKERALLKYHEQREVAWEQEEEDLKAEIEKLRNMLTSFPHRDDLMIRLQSYQGQVDHMAERCSRERFITPMRGGKTDYSKQTACEKRKASLDKTGSSIRRSLFESWRSPTPSDSEDDSITRIEGYTPNQAIYIWSGVKTRPENDRLFKTEWLRVVLDEAHVVRNCNTKIYEAISALNAERRIAVTGTPIVNGSKDLCSLASWIGVQPYSSELNQKLWSQSVDKPLKDNQPSAVRILRSITKSLVILRTKDMKVDGKVLVELPPIETYKYNIDLKTADREFYERAEAALRTRIIGWAEAGELNDKQSCFLVLLCRLRQLANDRRLVPNNLIEIIEKADFGAGGGANDASNGSGDISHQLSSAQVEELRLLLEAAITNSDTCIICMDELNSPDAETEPVISYCRHFYHRGCIHEALLRKAQCPYDARPLKTTSRFITLNDTQVNDDDDEVYGAAEASETDSAKIDAAIQIINAVSARFPTDKLVIFSNFTSLLRLIEGRLKQEGIPYGTFFGSHSKKRRDETLESFAKPLPPSQPVPDQPAGASASASFPTSAANHATSSSALLDRLDKIGAEALVAETNWLQGPQKLVKQSPGKSNPRVLLVSVGAGSVGLSLTAANHVILFDPWWQSAIEMQARDRCHRIGQTKPVKVYRLCSVGTVEERVMMKSEEKLQLAKFAFGGIKSGKDNVSLFDSSASTEARLRDLGSLFGMSNAEIAKITAATRRRR